MLSLFSLQTEAMQKQEKKCVYSNIRMNLCCCLILFNYESFLTSYDMYGEGEDEKNKLNDDLLLPN